AGDERGEQLGQRHGAPFLGTGCLRVFRATTAEYSTALVFVTESTPRVTDTQSPERRPEKRRIRRRYANLYDVTGAVAILEPSGRGEVAQGTGGDFLI